MVRGLPGLCLLGIVACLPALGAVNWKQPTADELKMTSDPVAPNAPAVYLDRDEYVNIPEHFHRVYARIKILTEKGREEYSEFEIPYEAGESAIRGVEGRTIHADGTVVPYTGSPYDKELVKAGNVRIMAKVFAMPDVQVGSIVEYQYELQYDDQWVFAPLFLLQERLFIHHAHYEFVPMQISLESTRGVVVPDAQGNPHLANQLLYDAALPPGAKVRPLANGYDVTIENVAPIPDEPYSPPLNSFSYRLGFYYTAEWTGQDYWNNEGRAWSKAVDRFAAPSDRLSQALASMVAAGDTDEQKLHKIYNAVMTVENTRFSRAHSQEENKAEGLQVKTAADIWEQKRGTPNEITRLFIALVRAAGMKASAMIVTERNERMLNLNYLQWNQLTDEIAIVTVDGKDVYFDPGQRYCDYGKLHWMHTQVLGIRQTDKGAQAVLTPAADYKDTVVDRHAMLQLDAVGKLTGTIQISMTGVEALRWRQLALREDEEGTKAAFARELQGQVPESVQLKTTQMTGLTDVSGPLVAMVDVSGSLGTATGKRIILPSAFFEARVPLWFAAGTRENPVDLHYPYAMRDQVKIALGPGLSVESVPTNAQIPFPKNADYIAKYGAMGTMYQQARLLALGNTVYSKDEYPQLREFFQKASAQDQQVVVLERTAATAAGGPGQ